LHDSLTARLDRLDRVKEVAQIGAVIGREFSHEQLAAVSSFCERQLTIDLDQLVESGLASVAVRPPMLPTRLSTRWSKTPHTGPCCALRVETITRKSRGCSSSASRRSRSQS
jgi:hypothetical protein